MLENLNDLPSPSDDAKIHSQRVVEHVRDTIEEHQGKITFRHFMDLVLYAPGLGYYSAGAVKFGDGGDYVTAPLVSPLFSRCLAKQCRQVIDQIKDCVILEVGAGSGDMAADILLTLNQESDLPKFYYILELSADLRKRQQETIKHKVPELEDRVIWLDELPKKKFEGIILANELLDAMPVNRFRIENNGPVELYVGYKNNKFLLQSGSISDKNLCTRLDEIQESLTPGYESEVNLIAESWVHTVGKLLNTGLLLIIDYGYPRTEYYHAQRNRGTLMCFYQHRSHANPFFYVGLQDITSHIDFTSIAEAALSANMCVAGFCTQANFLISTGISEMMSQIETKSTKEQIQLAQQVKKLTLPGQMGDLYKFMAITKNLDLPLCGFTGYDLRSRL